MKQTIAFQGFLGAYSDMACREVFPDAQTVPCATLDEAFATLTSGRSELAMIPVDNTLAGRVADVHRLIPESGVHIIGEHFQPIRHALLGVKGSKIEDLTNVHSHINDLHQCREIVKILDLKSEVYADTAGATDKVAELNDKSQAVIASELMAEIYDLDVLKNNIQDTDHNTTRFLVLSKDAHIPAIEDGKIYVSSFSFEVRNVPAFLYKALGGFATNGINMMKLESYIGEDFHVAKFYADVIGHPEERKLQMAMEELGFFAKDVHLYGTYEAHSFRKN